MSDTPSAHEVAEDQLRAAAHQLYLALQAAEISPQVTPAHTEITARIFIEGGIPPQLPELAGLTLAPTESSARALADRLVEHGVTTASVVVEPVGDLFASYSITVSALDAPILADLITWHLDKPRLAAHHLRTALTAAGIRAPDLTTGGAVVDLGYLSARDAYRLAQLLHQDGVLDLEPPQIDGDVRDVELLAQRLPPILTRVVGGTVVTDAEPGCGIHPDRIAFGYLTDFQAHRLATAVEVETAAKSAPEVEAAL